MTARHPTTPARATPPTRGGDTHPEPGRHPGITQAEGPRPLADDRGDVPGWVMITMMTAIVVLVLMGVFQEAVVNAVTSAFNSITGG